MFQTVNNFKYKIFLEAFQRKTLDNVTGLIISFKNLNNMRDQYFNDVQEKKLELELKMVNKIAKEPA